MNRIACSDAPVAFRHQPFGQLVVAFYHSRLAPDLDPLLFRVVDQEQMGLWIVGEIALRDVLPVAGKVRKADSLVVEHPQKAERAAAGEYIAPRGDLIITAPIVFGRLHVLPVAIEFLKAYPDIDIRIALADRVVNLQEDDIDLAIRIGELPDSSLVATRVGSIRHVVCAESCLFR